MKEEKMRRRAGWLLAAVMLMTALSPQLDAVAQLPDELVMHAGDVASVEVSMPLSADVAGENDAIIKNVDQSGGRAVSLTAGNESGTAEVVFRWLGLVPVKTMTVQVEQPRILIPGGRSLGVAAETEGVVVVGSSDLGRRASPAYEAGVRAGDVITSIDGAAVNSSDELSGMLTGRSVRLGILRDSEELEMEVTPEIDPRDGAYRLGVWVRESTAGVGTLTYYDPESGEYGALGHPITDVDTGILFPVGEGAVYKNTVVGVTRGREGLPGELTGEFFEEEVVLGEIEKNTEFGIFGSGGEMLASDSLYPDGLPAATRSEVREGPAQLLTTVDGGKVQAYDCEIEKVYNHTTPQTRSMVLRITDAQLLARTGGIVQGMSGSPIIQDGKIIGAVTHVMVDDPTRGYGLFIGNMLEAAG